LLPFLEKNMLHYDFSSALLPHVIFFLQALHSPNQQKLGRAMMSENHTQCIAIDASVAGTIIRTFRYYQDGERIKAYLYTFLSGLLLFTAAIVSNIEAVQQTLNITLDVAYQHVFVPVEALIWIRSLAIVLLIVAHTMRHIQRTSVQIAPAPQTIFISQSEQERTPEALPPPKVTKSEQSPDNFARVKAYMDDHPNATVREVARALQISATTANK
jgi:hypothetical protein